MKISILTSKKPRQKSDKSSASSTKTDVSLKPGDQVWLRPDDPASSDTERIAALVLGPRTTYGPASTVRVVITEPHVVSRDPRLTPNATLHVRRDLIVAHETDGAGDPPLLHLLTVGGKLTGIRRADGKTAQVRVRVTELNGAADRANASYVAFIDHTGARNGTVE